MKLKTSKGKMLKPVKDSKTPMQYKDRDLKAVNPLKEQFEPTESEPVRQHHRMAGY